VLGVLCQDGIVRFIDISTFAQLFDIGRLDDRVCNFVVASSGRHIVAVMDSGNLNIYNAHTLTRQINQAGDLNHVVLVINRVRETHFLQRNLVGLYGFLVFYCLHGADGLYCFRLSFFSMLIQ